MRLPVLLLVLSSSLFAGDVPIIPIEIRERMLPTTMRETRGSGSSVVIDVGGETRQGLVLLTAAHVVTKDMKTSHTGEVFYSHYPTNVSFEAYVDGMWVEAKLKFCSQKGDLALLTVVTDAQYPAVKIAKHDPEVNARGSLNGYVNGSNFNRDFGFVADPNFGSNFGLLHLDRTSPVCGQSGGGVLNDKNELMGILTGYPTETPWMAMYTRTEEINRFISAAWDGKWDSGPIPAAVKQPNRSHPRIPTDEWLRIDSKGSSMP